MDEPTPTPSEANIADETWDSGLHVAFGPDPEASQSVLVRLGARTGRAPSQLLRRLDGEPLRPRRGDLDWAAGETGRFQIRGELARGGVGVVLHGFDPDLGRDVAIKVLHAEHAENADLVQRFVEEAQIGGQLQHPGIVPIYELGLDRRDRPYFAMQLVRGQTLAEILRRSEDRGRQAVLLGIFEKVAQTLAYAHARGVVHRDVKPANVMVGSFGEVLVMDWGLAKVLGGGATPAAEQLAPVATARSTTPEQASLSGTIAGTPAYMAPEQARGEAVDARADVFALGALLAEMLTGEPPYRGDDALRQAARADLEPCRARLRACGADPALEALAQRCLADAAAERPADADIVAREVSAHLAGVAERARRAELSAAAAEARAAHERRARRLALALMAAVVLLVAGAAGVYLLDRTRSDRLAAQLAAALAEATSRIDRGDLEVAADAVARAEALAATIGTPEKSVEVAVVRGRHDRARRDRDLAERITRLRAEPPLELPRLAEDYGQIFASLAVEWRDRRPDSLAAQIEALASSARADLVRALEDWAWRGERARTLASPVWRDLLLAADRLDADAQRSAIRAAMRRQDGNAVRRLVEGITRDGAPPETWCLLADACFGLVGVEEAIGALYEATLQHDDDFWLHYRAFHALQREGRPEARYHGEAARLLQPYRDRWRAPGLERLRPPRGR